MSRAVRHSAKIAVIAWSLCGAAARAQTIDSEQDASKEICANAFERTQETRRASQLLEAKRQALTCASKSCPALLADPCLSWLEELDAAIPSVVVAVLDATGSDRRSPVTVDGEPAPEVDAGRPLPLDPGPHLFETTVDGEVVRAEVVLRAGEQLRRITLRAKPIPPPDASDTPLTTVGWVALSIGAAGVIVGTVTGVLALSKKADLDEVCVDRSRCPSDRAPDIDTMNTLAHVSTAGFIVGALGVVAGTVLLLIGDDGPGEVGLGPTGLRVDF